MAEIPVFKERRMTGINPENGLLASYYISDSYAGILRLSPNNSATLIDKNSGIEYTDEIKEYLNYEDSIANFLTQQFISVSTSDGVILDMRLSQTGLESSNLYVLGAASLPSIVTYINDKSEFYVGNIKMPINENAAGLLSENPTLYTVPTDETIGDTYLLVNEAKDDEVSHFAFKSAKSFIGKIIEDELSRLSGLPTGSIQWIPLTIKQYQELRDKSDNKHNSSSLKCDPIIRDFLLCDGARYKNEDFPELAKILYKEKITRWVPDNGAMSREELTNTYSGSKTFVVPDYRSMFLEYLIPLENRINKPGNKVGDWTIDSCKNQKITIEKSEDKHFHYIVLDNTIKQQNNTTVSDWVQTFESSVSGTDRWGLPIWNKAAKPLAKYGNMVYENGIGGWGGNYNTTMGCDTRICQGSGTPVSSIYYPTVGSYGGAANYCNGAGPTGGYILSNSSYYTSDIQNSNTGIALDNYIGASSWNMSAAKEITTETIDKINYTKDGWIYSKEKEYVNYDGESCKMLNYENTPEFFACLPLIKI